MKEVFVGRSKSRNKLQLVIPSGLFTNTALTMETVRRSDPISPLYAEVLES